MHAAQGDTSVLQRRIRLLSVAGILLTGLLAGIATAIPMYQHARGQIEASIGFSVRSQAQAVAQFFANMESVAGQVASRTQIRERLEAYNRLQVSLAELVEFSAPRLRDAIDQVGNVAGMVRYDANDFPVVELGQPLPRSWQFDELSQTDSRLHGPLLIDGNAYVLAEQPIMDRDGKRVGSDVLLFDLAPLAKLLSNTVSLDVETLQLLTHRDSPVGIELRRPERELKAGAGYMRIDRRPSDTVSGDIVIAARTGPDGERLTYFATELPGLTGWQLAVGMRNRDLYAPALSELVFPLGTIALLVLLGALLTSSAIRPLTRRAVDQSNQLAALGREQRSLLEMARGFVFRTDDQGRLIELSPSARDVLGGADLADSSSRLEASLRQASLHALAVARSDGEALNTSSEAPPGIVTMTDDTGAELILEISLIAQWEADHIKGLTGVARDITLRQQAEERLKLAASVFEGAGEGILIMNADRSIIEVNQAACLFTGYTDLELEGHRVFDRLHDTRGEPGFCDALWKRVASTGEWQGESRFVHKTGESFTVWLHISAVSDADGKVVRHIGIFSDITDRVEAQARIQRLAHYDVLTELPNRALLQDRLHHALERSHRSNTRVALLFIDLDRFKNVNDSLGHAVGDRLLQEVALRFDSKVREQDTLARVGGDEFLVILEDFDELDAPAKVACKLIDALERPIRIDHHELQIGASIGISVAPDDGSLPDDLIRCADSAMYQAKADGRNTFRYYTDAMAVANKARFEIETGLRRALDQEEFLLHYQPMACCPSGQVIGVEALIRWQHPLRGMIPPDVFIPVAEDIGLIEALGAWVLDRACTQARAWQDQGMPVRMSVNLSGQQISRGALVPLVQSALERSGLPPGMLELEITEGHVMDHVEQCIETLVALRELGVTLAIDDFGTGYSSLSYLKRLPVDRLKIDRSFVEGIPGDADDVAIVSTIVAMAQQLGLKVIAEGVETEAQLEHLRAHGCDEYQGYLLSRPAPADAVTTLLANAKADS